MGDDPKWTKIARKNLNFFLAFSMHKKYFINSIKHIDEKLFIC